MGGEPTDLASLTALLAAGLGERAPSGPVDGRRLATSFSSILETAREAWPGVRVAAEEFVAYLAERVEPTDDLVAALSKLRASDLYLACACVRGDTEALSLFDLHFGSQIDASLRRVHTPAPLMQDVQQRLRMKLFVAEGTAAPHITKYAGRGSLLAWIRVTAVRMALEAMKRTQRESPDNDRLVQVVAPDAEDPELHYLKTLYRQQFREALREAMGALTSGDRIVLKHHLVDGVSIDGIAAIYDVHRATAARRLTRIRETVADQTRKLMVERLRIPRDECDSILRLVRSQLDLSISAYLKSAGSEP